MGLDTTHDAWHGAYSSFGNWRKEIAKAAGMPPLNDMVGFGGNIEWDTLEYNDIHILLKHSDCDGEISWQDCKLVAEALTDLLDKLPNEFDYTFLSPKKLAERFIAGCMLAYNSKENLEFD
jgi:hypothetical protein